MRKFTVRTISLLICICFFPTGSFAQGTIVPVGSVSGTWALEGSPFLIQGDIEIPNDSTLTVEPGVKIEFQDHFELLKIILFPGKNVKSFKLFLS